MSKTKLGFAMCGSYCTFDIALREMKNLVNSGFDVMPIMSQNASSVDTRFGTADFFISAIKEITGLLPITTIKDAEPIGPKTPVDIMLVAPCTGNTLCKLSSGITDTAVTMAAKAHLRSGKPLVLAIATNDALGANAKNIGTLLNTKNVYFVPMAQDDCVNKPKSMISDFTQIEDTIKLALENRQIQPIIKSVN